MRNGQAAIDPRLKPMMVDGNVDPEPDNNNEITRQSSRMQVLPSSSGKSSSSKPYACVPCNRIFEHGGLAARHNLTTTYRKNLKDQGIPCFGPPPKMTSCPFCPRKFNRRDNLKPHMLTHMHLPGERKRNFSVSTEESVKSVQAAIDPRLKPMMGMLM